MLLKELGVLRWTELIFSEELDDIYVLLTLLIFLIVCTAFSILLAKRLRRLVVGVLINGLLLFELDEFTELKALVLVVSKHLVVCI